MLWFAQGSRVIFWILSVKVTQVDWFVKISIFKEMFLSAKGRLPDFFIYLFIYLFIYCIVLLKRELEFRPDSAVTPYFLFRCGYIAGTNRSRFWKH